MFAAVYGPAVGHGFISDDFGWILQSRVDSVAEALGLFRLAHGFYRPLVALSFSANYAFAGADPAAYGWTNLLLAIGSAALIGALLRSLSLSRGAAVVGAAVWLLNFHGINMALLWISGRTALMLVVGGVASILGIVRGSPLLACAGFGWALFSKEEAVLIPLLWAAAYVVAPIRRPSGRQLVALAAGAAGILVTYGLLRQATHALTPLTAPPYYRFTFDPLLLTRNLLEYVDRAGTFAVVTAIVAWIALRPRRPAVDRRLVWFGVAWMAIGYGLTLWLPIRSSLYACFPSVGAALAAAAVIDAMWKASDPRHRVAGLAALAAIPIVCAPIYVARNGRWVDLANLSATVAADLSALSPAPPPDTWLVLRDDRSDRVNLQSAFGALIADAVELHTGTRHPIWVDPPLTYAGLAGMRPPCAECPQLRLELRHGHLVRAR